MTAGPTGVTTPGLVWIPGVMGSASTTPPSPNGLTTGVTAGTPARIGYIGRGSG